MTLKDLSAFLKPDLELPYKGKIYHVPPPDYQTGLELAWIHTYGIAAQVSAEAIAAMPVEQREFAEALQPGDIERRSLGPAYQQMIDDNVPGPHIDTFGLYALYYWSFGESTADSMVAGQADPKAPPAPPSPTSRRTGSAKSSTTPKKATRSTSATKASRRS